MFLTDWICQFHSERNLSLSSTLFENRTSKLHLNWSQMRVSNQSCTIFARKYLTRMEVARIDERSGLRVFINIRQRRKGLLALMNELGYYTGVVIILFLFSLKTILFKDKIKKFKSPYFYRPSVIKHFQHV
jgi:hypothetical protein